METASDIQILELARASPGRAEAGIKQRGGNLLKTADGRSQLDLCASVERQTW